jgi:hypothetical protein
MNGSRQIPRMGAWLCIAWSALLPPFVHASDHLDTPSVIADPRADIGDVYAWMSPDGRGLNLAMTIVGHMFSDKLDYVFHIDSGRHFGKTAASTRIVCRFPQPERADCRVDANERVQGDAHLPRGLRSNDGHVRVFAGLRDDPFFNNVKGTRAAYNVALKALHDGAPVDAAACPSFDADTVRRIRDEWRHTQGGAARNLLAGWTPASLVISIDRDRVNKGGDLLAVWAATVAPDRQIDRAGRPLTGNALLGTLASDEVSDRLKEEYNAATPETSARFVTEIEHNLGLYDGFDGVCGNQLLAGTVPQRRYLALATLLADDRLWVNSASHRCTQLFAVELAALASRADLAGDCGGRAPSYDAANIWRSLLVDASTDSIDDGLHRDEREHSDTRFPFLAEPASAAASAHGEQ